MQELSRKTGVSVFLMIILIILGIIIAGGGMWYYMDKQATDNKAAMQAQIDDLSKEVKELKATSTATTAPESTTPATTTAPSATTTDQMAGWSTYSDTTANGFSFKYPANFSVTVNSDMPGGPEIAINPTGKVLKVASQSVNLYNFNWHQNVGEATTLTAFAASISAASKANTTVGSYAAIKAVNINKSTVDQVVFDAAGTIGSFYSRVALLLANKSITSAEATQYNTYFNLILSSFTAS